MKDNFLKKVNLILFRTYFLLKKLILFANF